MASRSASQDPVTAAVQRTREVHREFARNTRAALSGTVTGQRPKGGGGSIARSEHFCAECVKQGATPDESFLIHNDPDSVLAADPLPVPVPDDDNERRSAGDRYAEIRR
jgi:hypothetical protein